MTAPAISGSKRAIQAAILATGLLLAHAALTQVTGYDVTASGFSGFQFNGGALNPPLQLHRGRTYNFSIGTGPSHPFWIKTAQVVGSGSAYNAGIGGAGNGQTSGTMTFTVPQDAPDTLFYICGIHSNMTGTITVLPAPRAQDFDGDGKSDIFWRNASTGENYVYPMNGTAILGTEGYARTVADQNWQVAGIGDFDGDGKADVLWRNAATGENYVYLMNGTAISGEGYLRTVADLNWKVAGVGDLDGDGKADVVWRNSSTGENYLYPMDGLAIKVNEGYLRTVASQDWQVAGVGDVDGDGRADVVWRNASTGENYLYPMDGTSILGTEGYFRTVADLNWKIVGTGDFDGDGKSDVLWRNSSTGENYLYPMNGTAILGTEGYLRTVADQNWRVQATGDYDGDGKADVLWRNASTGENYLYFMDGTAIKVTEGYTRTVADQNWGVALGSPAAPLLADVVIAIDTTGSMDAEIALVQAQINGFVAQVAAAGVDLRVVIIADPARFCAPAPLGSGACPADENLPGYRHVPVAIGSTNAFQQILNTHALWSGSLRAGSQRTLIVVSDDDSDMSAADFHTQLLALDPAFEGVRFNAIVATLDPGEFLPNPPFLNICGQVGAAAMGTTYMNLAAQTGGIVGNLCTQDFAPYFASFASAIIQSPQ